MIKINENKKIMMIKKYIRKKKLKKQQLVIQRVKSNYNDPFININTSKFQKDRRRNVQ